MRLRIDGIFAMSRGFSGGKQWIKFGNTNLFILSTQDDDLTVFQNVQFEFWQVLLHYYMLKGHLRSLQLPNKVTMNTFTNNLFRINKLGRDCLYRQILSLVYPLRSHVTLSLSQFRESAYDAMFRLITRRNTEKRVRSGIFLTNFRCFIRWWNTVSNSWY